MGSPRYRMPMRILAIETSCDETAVAIVEDGRTVLSSAVASQAKHFEERGGVIPEDAARQQVGCMLPVLHQCLKEANVEPSSLDAVAVTKGPGLLGSLLVGTTTARAIATLWKKPLVGVHHTFGHLSSTWLLPRENPKSEGRNSKPFRTSTLDPRPSSLEPHFPVLTLSISGGHTDLWLRESHTKGTLLGRTRDDAAGEAFDKGAKLLGLPYPGGPALSKLAENGDKSAFEFPKPLHDDPSLAFSFSGLKTSLKYLLRDTPTANPRDVAASYEHAICLHLIDRLKRALERHSEIQEVHVVGGVSANRHLRALLPETCPGVTVRFPTEMHYCTDNAAMIASAAEFLIQERGEEAFESFETKASLPLEIAIMR